MFLLLGGGALPEWALVENANPSSDLENVSQACYKFVHQLETNSVHISRNPSRMLSTDPICFARDGFGVGSAILGYRFSLFMLELDSDASWPCPKFVQQLETKPVNIFQNPFSMVSYEPIYFARDGFLVLKPLGTPRFAI